VYSTIGSRTKCPCSLETTPMKVTEIQSFAKSFSGTILVYPRYPQPVPAADYKKYIDMQFRSFAPYVCTFTARPLIFRWRRSILVLIVAIVEKCFRRLLVIFLSRAQLMSLLSSLLDLVSALKLPHSNS
jgi:hypothetical protein